MSQRTLFWIAIIVLLVHVGLFSVVSRMRPLPKTRYIPPPNFGYKERVYIDPKTGEKEIHREIRVSTKLAGEGKK
jgi:hypothetical protein